MKLKYYIHTAAILLGAAVFIACDKNNKDTDVPAKAAVTGASANECPATSVVLTASAEGAQSYEWYRNALVIANATASTYAATSSGTYNAVGVNAAGKGAKSDNKEVTLTACPPLTPQLTGDAENTCPALKVRLTAVSAAAESFIWYKGTTVIPGVATAYYDVTESGEYAVAAQNSYGASAKSAGKTVTIKACPPAVPTISGSSFNSCPTEKSVILTASSEGATSYQWYRYTEAITGATASTYEVTTTGGYYATASNAAGASAKTPNAHIVYIDPCAADFNFNDLLGDYNAGGTPNLLNPPGISAWTSTITTVTLPTEEVSGEYEILPFADFQTGGTATPLLPIYLLMEKSDDESTVFFAVDTRRSLGTETGFDEDKGENVTYHAYFQFFFTTTEGTKRYIHWFDDQYYQPFWDAATKTLDFSGVYKWDTGDGADGKDHDIMVAVVAFANIDSKTWDGAFTDGYKNCKFVQSSSASGAPAAFTGERVSLPRPGTLRHATEDIQSRTIKFDPAKFSRKR